MKIKKEFNVVTLNKIKRFREFQRNFEIEWGTYHARLKLLIEPEIRYRFEKALDIYREAFNSKNDDEMMKTIDMMQRAYEALAKNMEDQGYRKLDPDFKCFSFDNNIFYVSDYAYQLPRLRRDHEREKGVNFISIEELFKFVPKDFMDLRLSLAKVFEGVEFTEVKDKT
jgi:hypothetical protein